MTGFPHHVMTFQDDKEYPGKVYSSGSSSTLLLKGIVDERGEYVCRWNNSLGELRHRNFTVIFAGTEISATTIPISVNLAALIFIIGIAIKLYLDKVLFFFLQRYCALPFYNTTTILYHKRKSQHFREQRSYLRATSNMSVNNCQWKSKLSCYPTISDGNSPKID